MSKVISSFLVGLGFDVDPKGAKEFERGIDSVRSKALQLGKVVAGGFGVKALTADFAASRDMLGKFSETFGVLPETVLALGNALSTQGGSLEGFMFQLENIERIRSRLLVGDTGFFAPAAKAGIDPNTIINASNATEAYLSLSDAMSRMDTQQRLNVSEALGLDEASIRLLSQGREGVDQLVEKFRAVRPVTDSSVESAAEFNRQWLEMKQNIGSAADSVSDEFLPVVNDAIGGINSWIGVNKELVNSNAIVFAGFSGLVASTGALKTLKMMSKYIPAIGTGLASVASGAAAVSGVATAAVGGYAAGTVINEYLPDDYKTDLGRSIAHVLASFGNDEAQAALDAEAAAGGFTPTFQKQVDAGYYGAPGQYGASESSMWSPQNNLSSIDFASQRRGATSGQNVPQRQTIEIPIILDGQALDRRTVEIVDGMAQTAIDDISSNTEG